MFKTTHTVKTLAAPNDVWVLVKDVNRWSGWLLGVEKVEMHGPVIPGVSGLLHLGGGTANAMQVHRCELGRLEIFVYLNLNVRMRLLIDISSVPPGSQVTLEGELLGGMSILHAWGWGKNLRTGLIPATRRLGALAQGTII